MMGFWRQFVLALHFRVVCAYGLQAFKQTSPVSPVDAENRFVMFCVGI